MRIIDTGRSPALDQSRWVRPVLGDNRQHAEVAALDSERSQRLTERAGGPGVGAAQ
jgi:hypothetical protein